MKKQFDNSIVPHFKQLLHFLVAEKKLTVFVEESVVEVTELFDHSSNQLTNQSINQLIRLDLFRSA